MSDVQTSATVYDRVSHLIGSEKADNETVEEYKKRALREFNGYSDDEFNRLPEGVQIWVGTAARVMQINHNRRRHAALPPMPGLDITLRRLDIDKPPEPKVPGRRRKSGQDYVTRVFTVLADEQNPESVDVEALKEKISQRWPDASYGVSALKQAMHAFFTARRVFGSSQQQPQMQAAAQ